MIVEQIIKNGATLIDVREEIELLADGEVPNAQNIPMGELEEKTEVILQMPQPIVFFCKSGGRAQNAVDYFKSKGLEDCHNGGGHKDVAKALED